MPNDKYFCCVYTNFNVVPPKGEGPIGKCVELISPIGEFPFQGGYILTNGLFTETLLSLEVARERGRELLDRNSKTVAIVEVLTKL